MRIAFGCDHAGYPLKKYLIHQLRQQGHDCLDLGSENAVDSVSYVPFSTAVARAIQKRDCDIGILCCGTGLGVSIAANKHGGIRAALCTNAYMAKMAREHNGANVLALGARVLGTGLAADIVQAFLTAPCISGQRHQKRIEEIQALETKQ